MDLKFEFSYKTAIKETFRVKSLIGQYDLENKEIVQKFSGNFVLPEKWNIGLIVGNSGSGKTSIAKHCFKNFDQSKWTDEAIIENFDKSLSMEEITSYLGQVGFNSVPYWLKPFSVLSNGEKSRVELARLFSEKNFIVYDEFTSLVDRDVAKAMSHSIQKLVRSKNKQFIAVTCHHDIQEWLLPDWIYDTDKKVFFCPAKQETKNLSLLSKEQAINVGNILKSIII